MQREIRITLYENAHLNPEGIPPLVAKYRRQLQFKPDKEPKFLFAPVGGYCAGADGVCKGTDGIGGRGRKERKVVDGWAVECFRIF